MRQTFIFILLVALFATLLITLLSVFFGSGYVQMIWLGWQIQTSAGFFIFLAVILSLLLLAAVITVKRYREKSKGGSERQITHINQLRWFEQLGCLSLLDNNFSDRAHIKYIFSHSDLLAKVIGARLARKDAEYGLAHQLLAQSSVIMKELAGIESIKLLMAENKFSEALQLLIQLRQQEKSAFIQSLGIAYEQSLKALWLQLAKHSPWLLVETSLRPDFDKTGQITWLSALLSSLSQSSETQQQALLAVYDQSDAVLSHNADLTVAKIWLALLQAIPDTALRRELLLNQLLKIQFDPVIFKHWLSDQRQQEGFPSAEAKQRIDELSQRYAAQPSIALASYYVLQTEQRIEETSAILDTWANDPDFAYIRLTKTLSDQSSALADLVLLYEGNKG